MLVLVHPSGPTAILGLCDILPRTFGLNGFLPLSAREDFSGDSTLHGAGGCIITLYFTSRTLRTMSAATRHTGHDRFIASRGAWLSQATHPLFTELRTYRMTLRYARRSLRVFVTRHTGSGRYFPCQIKHRVQISYEICLVLLRISTQIVKEQSALAPIKTV